MLTKVISGGQTGVDQAALRAAKTVGLETGGWAPKMYRTLDGNAWYLQKEFGLKQHKEYSYPPRTEKNICSSHGTLAIARTFGSAGERCTENFCKKHKKPYVQVWEDKLDEDNVFEHITAWMFQHEIHTLNVAGNSEQTAPGIGETAEEFLTRFFRYVIS